MGLDWRPLGKPKLGYEIRFNQLFRLLQGTEKQELSFVQKLQGKRRATKEELLEEWFSISDPCYETIKAPRVGRDKIADDWVLRKYEESDKSLPLDKYMSDHEGYYVIELAEELDGVPMYVAFHQDENVFRAQFLNDCKDLIGNELLNETWGSKLAEETLKYGQKLLSIADKVAKENGLLYLKDLRLPPDTDEDSLESKVHILYSAAKWLIFYGKNGHGYEADF
jgi:hypothetical protein